MKKRIFRLLFLSVTLLALLTACEYDFIVPTPPVAKPPADDAISFSQDIQPFLTAKCVTCHSGGIPPTLSTGQSYAALVPAHVTAGNPETSDLYKVCSTGGSMSSYTSAAELNLLYRWIYAGAKND